MSNETMWDVFEDGHEYTVGEIQERLQPVMDAAASRLAELQAERDDAKLQLQYATICARCHHQGEEHGEFSKTQLPWADEYSPECQVNDCECGGFVFYREDFEKEKQALHEELDALRGEQAKKIEILELAFGETLDEAFVKYRANPGDWSWSKRVEELEAENATLTERAAIAAEAMNRLGPCHLVTDRGDAIFGAFRQTHCMTHGHALAPCPVGLLRSRYDALAATSPAVEPQP